MHISNVTNSVDMAAYGRIESWSSPYIVPYYFVRLYETLLTSVKYEFSNSVDFGSCNFYVM